MNASKQAVTSAVFDREFMKGFYGNVPNIYESKMLIVKRPETDRWAPGKYYFLTETYDPKKDWNIRENSIEFVMNNVAKRCFEEELKPVKKCNSPHFDYVGWYKDVQTDYAIHVCLGNIWSPNSWQPRKGLDKMLHTTEEVPKYYWRKLPDVIEMMKEGKVAGEQAVIMITQEIERRLKGVTTTRQIDRLSRLILGL